MQPEVVLHEGCLCLSHEKHGCSTSCRQLATAAAGVPLFEIFVTKNGERDYEQQVIFELEYYFIILYPP